MGRFSPSAIISRERRRLRRHFISKVKRHGFALGLDRLMDLEFAKAGVPLLPFLVVFNVDGRTRLSDILLILGLPIALGWGLFIFWTVLSVSSRYSDKVYMSITRKKLSVEYRR